ncbi:hypothetical protein ACLBWC_19505, partial [Pseudomonas aeruginosa]
MPAETPSPRPDADPPQCALPEARPDRDAGTKLRAAVLGANDGLGPTVIADPESQLAMLY